MVNRFHPFLAVSLLLGACAPTAASVSGPAPDDRGAPPPPAPTVVLEEAPENWWLLDTEAHVFGTGTERAYRELLSGREPERTVVVAILDSGVDIDHPDLADNIWTNSDEVAGNGVDDDGNGYPDDVHGWNFLGAPDGRNVEQDTYEMTRLYVEGRTRFANVQPDTLSPEAREDYETYLAAAEEFQAERADKTNLLNQYRNIDAALDRAMAVLRAELGTDSLTVENVEAINSGRVDVMQAQSIYLQLARQGATPEVIDRDLEVLEEMVEYNLNPSFDPRPIVGDDPDSLHQRYYGNNDVEGPTAEHGTHVAGIVAAERGNGMGIDGIASAVQIMSVRTVPDGDERDKDVANAIRYAADNGAQIINMSFGKGYSPNKELVDEAVRYAEEKGVLFVHAAGNDGEDVGVEPSYPTRVFLDGDSARAWIEVGALSWKSPPELVAPFSNYGANAVHVFAPGVDILSTIPDGEYEENSGTSMAAPVVTGIAALIMSYYPDLTAEQVKEIILQSAVRQPDLTVTLPGDGDRRVPFGELSITGGIVNAYEALRLAEQISGSSN